MNSRNSSKDLQNLFKILNKTFAFIWENSIQFLLLVLLFYALTFVLAKLVGINDINSLSSYQEAFPELIYFLLISMFIDTISFIAICFLAVSNSTNIFLELDKVYQLCKSSFLKLILASVIYNIFIIIGFMFFILPGIILTILLTFGKYYILLKRDTILDATKNSLLLVKNMFWPYLSIWIMLQFLPFLILPMLAQLFSAVFIVFNTFLFIKDTQSEKEH